MATLEVIRRRAGILMMVVIGLAMLGFILGDFNLRPSTKVAEIDGKTYQVEDYLNEQQILRNFYKLNYGQNLDPQIEQTIEDETWRRIVRRTIMDKSYHAVGVEVSLEELKAMVAGDQVASGNVSAFSEPHPIVKQMFTNPETGQFNQFIMMNYFNSLEQEEYAQEKERWVFIENEIIEERLNQKYITLISKGLSPSSLEVKDHYMENGKRVDFNFISKNFSEVSDEDISFTEAELKAYYKEHLESYKQNESRTLEYVVFDVVSSENDDKNAQLWAKQTKSEFGRTENERLVLYVNSVSDEPYDSRYYTADELSPLLRDSLLNASSDFILGPYLEDDSYKISRKKDMMMRPDSVRARHILIGYSIVGDVNRAQEIADSLKTVISNGGNFNLVAMQYSSDESTRSIGGDLGWFKEGDFEEVELNDACFENKEGDLVLANTSYGTHIIKIEAQSRPVNKIQIATIVHNVIPSNETDQEYYSRAVKFRGKATNSEKFAEQAIEFGLDPRVIPSITKDQRAIPGLESPVRIIGWAYAAEEGEVSNIFDFEDRYLVATLTEVNQDGYSSFESVRNEIELAVKKEKKGEILMAQLKEKSANQTDLESIAASENLSVSDASQVMFANAYVTGIGMEPFIVGASMYLPEEKVSGPFIGENGILLLNVTNREVPLADGDMSASESRLKFALQSRSNFETFNALVEEAKVEDNRLKIFYSR